MKFSEEQICQIVKYCDGDVKKVSNAIDIICKEYSQKLFKLPMLPNLNHYGDICSFEKYSALDKFIKDLCKIDRCQRYSIYTIEDLLDDIYSRSNIYKTHFDNIDLSADDYDELELRNIIEKTFPGLSDDIINSKFGSVKIDW